MSDVIKLDPEKADKPRANIDVLSLEQALRDFEIANSRVVDLTQRLLESERRRAEITNELEQLRLCGAVPHSQPAPTLPATSSPVTRIAKRVARKVIRTVSRRFGK